MKILYLQSLQINYRFFKIIWNNIILLFNIKYSGKYNGAYYLHKNFYKS